MNSQFINALGIVAACYILLQALFWITNSAFWIMQGFGYWLHYTVLPYTWQIAIAVGVIYLLYTALTSGRSRF